MNLQVIQCNDDTCKHNVDGYCKCPSLTIEVGQDNHLSTVNICTNYEDKRDATPGEFV